jgi:tripartite-type tricarboxylate transporter receptor subunit TctC
MTMVKLLAAALAAVATCASAAYPDKPIKVLVGYAPGGSTDVVARLLAPRLQEKLGQPVIIENKPGGAGEAARATSPRR